MDFPLVRRERDHSPATANGNWPVIDRSWPSRISHTPERYLPGGANWVVQKFGGTSVGKFAIKIAEDIVL